MADPNYDKMLTNLKKALKMSSGPIDEGKKDNRNNVGTGSVKQWNTYPGDVYVQPHSDDDKDFGTLAVHFSGRERVADYVLGTQKDTNDHQSSGKVTAEYEITRRGNLYLSDVAKDGGQGRVGDAVVRHLQALNDTNVA